VAQGKGDPRAKSTKGRIRKPKKRRGRIKRRGERKGEKREGCEVRGKGRRVAKYPRRRGSCRRAAERCSSLIDYGTDESRRIWRSTTMNWHCYRRSNGAEPAAHGFPAEGVFSAALRDLTTEERASVLTWSTRGHGFRRGREARRSFFGRGRGKISRFLRQGCRRRATFGVHRRPEPSTWSAIDGGLPG